MSITRLHHKRGFTLIELLTVIAIIGILAAILIPSVGAVRVRAAMASSASDIRQVITGYQTFSTGGTRNRSIQLGPWTNTSPTTRMSADDSGGFAAVLAFWADLNDAALYFISSSGDAPVVIPRVVLTGAPGSTDRNISTGDGGFDPVRDRISYNMARVGPNASSTVPLMWTKGLDSDGEWGRGSVTSPWETRGGHIGFVGGNVEFFERILEDENPLSIADGAQAGQRTVDISEAIPANPDRGSKILTPTGASDNI